ncbi:MAG: ABC transporter substrate-binding protein [Chloroflexi bacterium]|nr:ABC transporter substrate-binding protein [Chloroflexota bacterium]
MRRSGGRHLLVALALAAVISGCLSGNTPPAPSQAAGATDSGSGELPTEAASQPSDGASREETLVVAIPSEPGIFSPAATDAATRRVNRFIYSGLYRLDASRTAVPDLAAELPQMSEDGLQWRVSLRAGSRFHDGRQLRSADVVSTYQLALSPNCPFADLCSSVTGVLESVEPVNVRTVVFRLRRPHAPFLATALAAMPILPKRQVEASMSRFLAGATEVNAGTVRQLSDEIAAATNAEACLDDPAPETCDLVFYVPQLERLLRRAGLPLPERRRFPAGEGGFDRSGYAAGLLAEVEALSAALAAQGRDQLAAAFPLLDIGRRPIGSGVYRLDRYRPGTAIDLVRAKNSPREAGDPAAVRFVIIPDPAAAATALKIGLIDWLPEVSSDEVPGLESEPNLRVEARPEASYRAIVFNTREGHPYAAREARQAFAMCIDRRGTLEEATSGRGRVAVAMGAPDSWFGPEDASATGADRAAAQARLRAAGWRRGNDGIFARGKARLSSDVFIRPSRGDLLAYWRDAAEQLRACGIELTVRELGFSGNVLLSQIEFPNEFETFLAEFPYGRDPDQDFAILHSNRATTRENPGDANFGGWRDPTTDQLIEAGRTTLDPAAREAAYGKLHALVAREIPIFPFRHELAYTGLSSRVSGPNGPVDLTGSAYDWAADRWRLEAGDR